jgi:hypothetical protein
MVITGRVREWDGRAACVSAKTVTAVDAWGREAAVIPGVSSNGMNGRKREGTVEIPHGRRRLRRREPLYKAQAEVGGDAGREVGRGHSVAKKARTAKPAGAKGLDSSHADEEGGIS